jgi:hypothetical protein
MSLEVDYLPVAVAAGANVDTQANFDNSGYQEVGFTSGLTSSAQLNKVLRQATMPGAALANFISNTLGIPILDDGNLPELITNLTDAINAAASGTQTRIVSVPFSATPVFDASQGSTFEITLTGNVTSSTLINVVSGTRLLFIVNQDSVGGHAFVPPAILPMAAISTTASKRNVQAFIVNLAAQVLVDTPLTVQ